MRILLISDVHANSWALRAVEKTAGKTDYILCAGDTVNYGPDPAGAIHWLQEHKAVTVRGNHDHAVGFAVDPKASPLKQPLAIAMRDWTRDQLSPADMGWLLTLSRRLECRVGGASFMVVHGTPVNVLYDYRLVPDASEQLLQELTSQVRGDVLLVGHTHLPLLRNRGQLQIVNPGSVGQPLDGNPHASYAIWQDGQITLHRAAYDHQPVLDALSRIPLPEPIIADLINTLRDGGLPHPTQKPRARSVVER